MNIQECCLCLLRENDKRPAERFKQYGTLWCCKGCLIAAVSVAYFAACRLGKCQVLSQENMTRAELALYGPACEVIEPFDFEK